MEPLPFPDAETCYRLKAGAASVTRVTLASEDMAVPRDSEEYKQLYDNIGVVGSGTFGSVYCAVERETEEYVAAKYMILQIEKVCAILNAFQCIKIFKKLATLIIIKTQCHNTLP